jgi:hypothetical protein
MNSQEIEKTNIVLTIKSCAIQDGKQRTIKNNERVAENQKQISKPSSKKYLSARLVIFFLQL